MIQKGDTVKITELCMTPHLRGLTGKVVRKPRNNHYNQIKGEQEAEYTDKIGGEQK